MSIRSFVQRLAISGSVLGAVLGGFAVSEAQVIEEREVAPPASDRVIQDPTPSDAQGAREVGPPTSDRVIQDRAVERDQMGNKTIVEERVVERRRVGELYVAGFGGFTWGHQLGGVDGTGSAKGQDYGSQDLANSVVYGGKVGYFHPGRLNWLGLEAEAFNTTPHIEQGDGLPGTHLRVTTLAFNVIARTKLGCRHRDDVRRDGTVHRDGTVYDRDSDRWSPLDENLRCPLQLYAGAGPGIFFAETSNQFGRSTDNGRVGLNALAGAKYFMNRNLALFAEYKFNYAHFNFVEAQGSTAGFKGDYTASHVVGGLALHW
ncbi:MAG: porin family protein [Nitrospira sp.]